MFAAAGAVVGRAVGGGAFGVVGAGHGAGRVERVVRLDDGAAQPARRVVTRADLDFNLVAGADHGGPGRRAGQDHVAGVEGDEPGQVGDDVVETEEHVPRRPGILDQFPVHPGPEPERGQVHGAGDEQARADRSVAVQALRPQVGAPVGVAQVVDAEVVRGGDPGHAVPGLGPGDPAGRRSDDERHLALEGQQLAARGACHGIAALGQRRGGLEEVRRPGRRRAAFGRAAPVARVHRDDLAGHALQGGHGAQHHIRRGSGGRLGRPARAAGSGGRCWRRSGGLGGGDQGRGWR